MEDAARAPTPEGDPRIDLTHDADVAYWCRVLDVAPRDLRRAIQRAGPRLSAVHRILAHGRTGGTPAP